MDTTSLDSIDSAAFDPGQWEDGVNTLDVGDTRISLRTLADSATLTLSHDDAAGTEALVMATADGTVTLRLDVPLGDAVGFWHPDAGWERTLPADWSAWRGLSLVRSAPVGCLYDAAGQDRALQPHPADRMGLSPGVHQQHRTLPRTDTLADLLQHSTQTHHARRPTPICRLSPTS
ncbi:hypothetical protein SAMN02787144_1004347 [Streptomyces atratus]|uniref:Uncharacterized protein n=1 Tax=Streptomyces atratus TaxID=1893 RepID=A0A1K1YL53_STRAR|nr:hypothetical protein SAMN02787144_1004347 [Streptomyces atratus]